MSDEQVNSAQDTAYTSKITYDVETYAVKSNIDLSTKSGQKEMKNYLRKQYDMPSNL